MENHNIFVELMSTEDILYLKNTLNTEFDNFWSYSILEKEYENPNTTYIVAKFENEIVGFAGILKVLDEATLMNIVTKKDKRNLGIGSTLLSHLIDIAKSQKMKTLTLEVNEHNVPAINLYKKFNFKEVGIRKNYYDNTDSAILMTLDL